MHFFGMLCTLVTAGLVSAAPTTTESYIDVQAEDDYLWNLSGWGNPRCEGTFLWLYQGTGNACVNVKTFAASVSYAVTHDTKFELAPYQAVCGFSRLAKAESQPNITTVIVGGSESNNAPLVARAPAQGCFDNPVMSFRVSRA
ncbi:hypothetical protein B0I37DRAFT_381968 [Chaetomium sp. MPI-CAGE-AT-0009]|nr:hypothetical protein B0I37DRAFT_381968 [Chaetomium sp. MPI-CAGE-AT-0009]